MGFLDHSTNNIIVDAVLTDAGRRALSRNDGSFQIVNFALGDDEVDYSLIQQYGRAVGKEKIEKNTPVMEALTAGSLALKYKLVSISNEFITYLPKITAASTDDTNFNLSSVLSLVYNGIGTSKQKNVSIDFGPAAGSNAVIDSELMDNAFKVEVNSLFLKINGEEPDVIYPDNIVVYDMSPSSSDSSTGKTTLSFVLSAKSLTSTAFSIYSTSGGSVIRTFVKVTGVSTGITATFEVQISQQS